MSKSLGKATLWTAGATFVKLFSGLLIIKLLAFNFGSEGLGRAANYMTLLTVLSVMAGAGIFNGITKYVAEYEQHPSQLRAVISTSLFIILFFSVALAEIGLIFADKIAFFIFQQQGYAQVIQVLAVIQIAIALGNYFIAILKGLRAVESNAIAVIASAIIGVILFALALYMAEYKGALIGLALIPAVIVLPAYDLLKKCGQNCVNFRELLKPYWHSEQAKNLLKFSLMTLSTAITIPLVYILLRNWLSEARSINEVGLWQGMSKISDAYLQFITAAFSVYLLPTFAKLNHWEEVSREVIKSLRFVFLTTTILGLFIYVFRNTIIALLFSDDFIAMQELFIWQLIGDIFKISAYVFGYLILAKAAIKIYILGEVLQSLLLLFLGVFLIPDKGALGAVQTYMWTYMIYFLLCLIIFMSFRRRMQ